MIPDAFTNLQVINCTNQQLLTTGISSYQMASWFPPFEVNAQSYSPTSYLLQFSRGTGDEDDAGNLTMNFGPTNFLVYGGSTSASGHYIDLRDFSPSPPWAFVLGLVTNGSWPTTSESAINIGWFPFSYLNLGPLAAPDSTDFANKALAIVDLSQIYSSTLATQVQQEIVANTLTPQQTEDLWGLVSINTQIGSQH